VSVGQAAVSVVTVTVVVTAAIAQIHRWITHGWRWTGRDPAREETRRVKRPGED
jgi:hypothetical protein